MNILAVGKYGTGCLYDRIKNFILKLGGKFLLNENVINFKSEDEKIIEILTSRKTYKIKNNEVVISTLPISITSRLLGKKNQLKFRGICSVYLFYKQNQILPKNHHWLYFDSEKLLFNRVTENKKMSKFVAPKNKSYLTAEITYTQGDKFSKLNPKEIINIVKKQMAQTGLVDNKKLIDASINFEPFVYPVQFSDYKEEVMRVKSRILIIFFPLIMLIVI